LLRPKRTNQQPHFQTLTSTLNTNPQSSNSANNSSLLTTPLFRTFSSSTRQPSTLNHRNYGRIQRTHLDPEDQQMG